MPVSYSDNKMNFRAYTEYFSYKLPTLLSRSGFVFGVLMPFLLMGANLAETPRFEVKGVLSGGDYSKVYVFDHATGSGSWIRVGQSFGDMVLVNEEKEAISEPSLDGSGYSFHRTTEKKLNRGVLSDFKRNTDADIAFDANLIILFERGQEIRRKRRHK